MKKRIALSFLLFANTILLAHAVIPHHHLDDIQSMGQCNQSSCHGNMKDCPLTTIYIKFDEDKPIVQSVDFNFDLPPYLLDLFSNVSILPIPDDIGLPFRQKPYLLSYYTDYVSQSLGRRAPPFWNYEL